MRTNYFPLKRGYEIAMGGVCIGLRRGSQGSDGVVLRTDGGNLFVALSLRCCDGVPQSCFNSTAAGRWPRAEWNPAR